jgi:hypothetical protein
VHHQLAAQHHSSYSCSLGSTAGSFESNAYLWQQVLGSSNSATIAAYAQCCNRAVLVALALQQSLPQQIPANQLIDEVQDSLANDANTLLLSQQQATQLWDAVLQPALDAAAALAAGSSKDQASARAVVLEVLSLVPLFVQLGHLQLALQKLPALVQLHYQLYSGVQEALAATTSEGGWCLSDSLTAVAGLAGQVGDISAIRQVLQCLGSSSSSSSSDQALIAKAAADILGEALTAALAVDDPDYLVVYERWL